MYHSLKDEKVVFCRENKTNIKTNMDYRLMSGSDAFWQSSILSGYPYDKYALITESISSMCLPVTGTRGRKQE